MTKSLSHPYRRSAGFTLIELLVVIAIIAILAGLLLPVFAAVKNKAMKGKAKYEMQGLATAFGQYDSIYGRMPASKQAAGASTAACPDFTFGTVSNGFPPLTTPVNNPKGQPLPRVENNNGVGYQAPNSELMAILMDVAAPPVGVNPAIANHAFNPQQNNLITPHMAPDAKSSGVGPDLIYRDPWGNPYVITLDMNGDNHCRDAVYSLQTVSGVGYGCGLNQNPADPAPNNYESSGTVMIWSLGKDGSVDVTKAWNQGANKDNVISWQ